MKELLFRGRFKVNKFRWNGTPREYEFIESKTHHISAIHFNNNGDISHVVIPYKDTCITLFPDYFTTFDIQQYTGVKDKKGVRIFEGDVLEYSEEGYEYMLNAKVVFDSGTFYAIGDDGGDYRIADLNKGTAIEVIGNIYDNSDLIK